MSKEVRTAFSEHSHSYLIIGSEEQHIGVRVAILQDMMSHNAAWPHPYISRHGAMQHCVTLQHS